MQNETAVKNLLDFTKEELTDYIVGLGLPKFRGEQLYLALQQGKKIDEITNLPKSVLEVIKDKYPSYKIVKKFNSVWIFTMLCKDIQNISTNCKFSDLRNK